MDYIGAMEEKAGSDHSFDPQGWPDNVEQAPLTEDEQRPIQDAYDPQTKVRSRPRTRRYLPCHYFDYICGSSTGG